MKTTHSPHVSLQLTNIIDLATTPPFYLQACRLSTRFKACIVPFRVGGSRLNAYFAALQAWSPAPVPENR